MHKLTKHELTIREAAERDLLVFAKLLGPTQLYGAIHEELFSWWQDPERAVGTLVLLPRDLRKSHCVAVKTVHAITKDPCETVLYVSATSTLAEKQLYAMKNILESRIFQRYWPEFINKKVNDRERWTTDEISIDHPLRKEEFIRDATIKAAGVTSNIVGLHASRIVLDDLVVPDNAYTGEGRSKVAAAYSQLASIASTGAKEDVVGTRYHPLDLYDTMMNMQEDDFDDEGEQVGSRNVYDVFQRVVETEGEFLWPKAMRDDGKFFGFDNRELARKKAKYVDTAQYYAQYYNNPNDPNNRKIQLEDIQYYDRKKCQLREDGWYINDKFINVFAGIDFAFSLKKRADYTAIGIVGMDSDRRIYILEIDRFKTDGNIQVYFNHIEKLWIKWGFKKLRAEVTVAQASIVKELKEVYLPRAGVVITVDEYRPNRNEGTKQERIDATLLPRYQAKSIWHYKGGNCSILEEEIRLANPPHDDVKDAVTAAVDIAVPPMQRGFKRKRTGSVVHTNRFGGARG